MGDFGQHEPEAKWCLSEIAGRLAQVLDSMTEQHHSTRITGSETPSGPLEWSAYVLNGAVSGCVWIGVAEQCWKALGGEVLKAAGVDPDEETSRETFTEVASQALSAFGQSVSARAGAQCSIEAPQRAEHPSPDAVHAVLTVGDADGTEHEIAIAIAPSVLAGLGVDNTEPPAVCKRAHGATAELTSANPARSQDGEEPQGASTLGLLLDVELPVSLSFGRTQLPIKDVMKLGSGSIIELNRHVAEPVELIVNNCVIARGEVVVIEGNYGIRINEIISPQDRLRSLN